MGYTAHDSAIIDPPADIGEGTRIWHFTHVMSGCRIGENCSLGQNVFVATGVVIGSNVKIQNGVSIYEGTTIDDDVFLGPACVLTNVSNPRSQVNRRKLYETTRIRRGATIGANATVVCGTTIGRYAFVAAGAVITRDVEDYAFMVGVPARRIGWASRHGHRLVDRDADGHWVCPESRLRYHEHEGTLRCIDLSEEAQLPATLAQGLARYRQIRRAER